MFGFLKKAPKSEEEKLAESLPRTKKVQFEDMPIARVEDAVNADVSAVLNYNPVNYYASKDMFLQCIFYYSEDYSDILMQFVRYEYDAPKGKTRMWRIDKEIMRGVMRKFGQNIQ